MIALGSSFRFTHALVRQPGISIANGLRAADTGNPDPELFNRQHRAYVDALEQAGVIVCVLSPWEDFPDSVFIEDSALCLPMGAVIMRPGAPSRTGESFTMAGVLETWFDDIRTIKEPGFIDGGDILVTEGEIIVGLSGRTDMDGAQKLQTCVSSWGMTVRILETPADVLHFKTACGLLDAETILLTEQLAAMGFFSNYRTLVIPEGEEAAANAIRVNERVFVSSGFPKTSDMLTTEGYDVIALDTSEAAKVDAGLSCMSLRFTPPN